MTEKSSRTWYCRSCLNTFEGDVSVCSNLQCKTPRPPEGWDPVYDAGDVIDRHYRVIRRLATGGAGIAYLAREIDSDGAEIDLDLAVKVLYASRDQGSYLRRLSQEAQILQELAHPHIVEYRGFVHRTGHSPYLVTRFEHGGSLLDHLRRRGGISIRETAAIGVQVLQALERAHEKGVVHRDLKPENVLLEEVAQPDAVPVIRVADFGIAKISGGFSDRLTRVGAFVGTPQYAAPEQFDGLQPTPATDVFAVGGMIYFCLHKQPLLPFADRISPEDARELLVSRLPPRLKVVGEQPEMIRAMEDALSGAMALEPQDRITVRKLEGMLEAITRGERLEQTVPTMVPVEGAAADTLAAQTRTVELPAPVLDREATRRAPVEAAIPEAVPDKPRKKRHLLRWGCLLVLLFLLCGGLVGGALAFLGLVKLPTVQLPRIPGISKESGRSEPVVLSATDPDPARQADYNGIQAMFAQRAPEIVKACKVVTTVPMSLVILGDGSVQSATVQGTVKSDVAACVQSRVQAVRFGRVGDAIVRVQVRLGR
jgi:hypothetical protein